MTELFEQGASYSNGEDPLYGTRQFFVATEDEMMSYAAKTVRSKSYRSTGYRENADGTVFRGDYIWQTYNETRDIAEAIGRGIISLELNESPNIGIFSINRSEWYMSALGLFTQSLRIVPIYPTLGADAVEFTVSHAELKTAIISPENFSHIKKAMKSEDCGLKNIIIMDAICDGLYGNTIEVITDDMKEACESAGIQLIRLSDVIKAGTEAKETIPLNHPKPDDLAFIMYTSGTTGTPKGVMLTHNNIVAPISGMLNNTPLSLLERQNPTYFSYLPAAHIFEHAGHFFSMAFGARVAFSQGDIRKLPEDLQASQPHILPGVPRVFLKFFQGVWANVEKESWIKRWYIQRAYNYQVGRFRAHKEMDPSYDSRVFATIRAKLGLERVRIMVSGAAPTPPFLFEFMNVVTGGKATYGAGYGMTESAAGIAVSNDYHPGHVGAPLSCNEVTLLDIPEMAYLNSDKPYPRGEIIARGPNIFQGYFKDDKATEETFYTDPNGNKWLKTGDVGRLNPNGTYSVIDRKKNLIKLAQGEYVAVEKLEDAYSRAPLIGQIWCYGNAYKSQMVAVVVPNCKPIYDYAVEKGWWPVNGPTPTIGDLSDEFIATYREVVAAHLSDIKAMIKEQMKPLETEMFGFEKVKAIHVETRLDPLGQGFNEENGTQTPTMKKKRKALVEMYLAELKELYASIGEPHKDGENF